MQKPILANLFWICWTLIASISLAGVGQAAEGKFALVIGNSEYKNLGSAATGRSAAPVAKALRESGFEVIELTNASNGEMRAALGELKKNLANSRNPIVVFHFAGHTARLKGRDILLPSTASIRGPMDILAQGIPLTELWKIAGQDNVAGALITIDGTQPPEISSYLGGIRKINEPGRSPGELDRALTLVWQANQAVAQASNGGLLSESLATKLQSPEFEIGRISRELVAELSASSSIGAFTRMVGKAPPPAALARIRQPGPAQPDQQLASTRSYQPATSKDIASAPALDTLEPGEALYSRSYALVVGIDDYTNGWPKLSLAVDDSRAVAAVLEARGFEVELLENPTRSIFIAAIRRFFIVKGEDPDARLMFWFAGHGYTENEEGFIIPADAPVPEDSTAFRLAALPMRDFSTYVRLASAKHVLAVFDACFAGTIFGSTRGNLSTMISQSVRRPVRQFVTSGSAYQEVSDDGAFRKLFLRALSGEEQADLNNDGYLTGSELGLYLTDRITNLTRGRQTPQFGKLRDMNYDQGDFVFAMGQ